jgi:hypothetical protein
MTVHASFWIRADRILMNRALSSRIGLSFIMMQWSLFPQMPQSQEASLWSSLVFVMLIMQETRLNVGHIQVFLFLLFVPQLSGIASIGSEFVAARIAMELIESLRDKLRMFGVPIEGAMNVYCDNDSVVNNSTKPESTLKKKHNAIAYHHV